MKSAYSVARIDPTLDADDELVHAFGVLAVKSTAKPAMITSDERDDAEDRTR